MSGFAGMVTADAAAPDKLLLQKMAERLQFRGPDGTHIWAQPGAGFCFTFLRTGPAAQAGKHPVSIDGRVWLIGDLRLDGRDELRRQLEQRGENLAPTATDEELVLRAWRQRGEESFKELLGDFAFAIWDAPAQTLWCVRDLLGAKPFFYARLRDRLIFSNTLDVVRRAPELSSTLDRQFIGDFLLQDWCPDPGRTAFRDISRLPAGFVARYSREGLEIRRYTSFEIEEPLRWKREEDYVEHFRGLLEQAVRERLPRGPAAIFLSGGLDSTSVAAVAVNGAKKREAPLDLRAYTVDYQPLFDDQEGRLAAVAGKHIGIPLEILAAADRLPYAGWDDSLPPMPEPLHEPYRSAYLAQIRQIAQHGRVVFTGYGGDGIMTGQAWPYLVYLLRNLQLATAAKEFGGYIWKNKRIPPLRGGFRSGLQKWVHPQDPMAEFPVWLAPQFERDLNLRERWLDLKRPNVLVHPLYPNAHATFSAAIWPSLLEVDDAQWSGVAVESRSPLLDLRIMRFLLRVPPVPLCIDKEILRRAVGGLLPQEILGRPKTPLEGDPLALHVTKQEWRLSPVPAGELGMDTFVDWGKLSGSLKRNNASSAWSDLRPISLLYWLKSEENRVG